MELLTTAERGRLEPAVLEVLDEAIEQPVVGLTAEMNDRWRHAGGADPYKHNQHLVVGAEEDVVLACARGADLDRIDAEQRFDPFVWVDTVLLLRLISPPQSSPSKSVAVYENTTTRTRSRWSTSSASSIGASDSTRSFGHCSTPATVDLSTKSSKTSRTSRPAVKSNSPDRAAT